MLLHAARAVRARGVHTVPGRVSRFTLNVQDLEAGVSFYKDALQLRIRASGAKAALLGAVDATSCDVGLTQADAGAAAAAPEPKPLTYPYLTFGVSNLKTSSRHARKHGGAVKDEKEAVFSEHSSTPSPIPTVPAQATFADPSGYACRVLHLFRRNPTISVTLGVGDVAAALRFYRDALQMRVVQAEEQGELHLPLPILPSVTAATAATAATAGAAGAAAGNRVVLSYGPVYNSTSIVLESAGLSGAASASASGASGEGQGKAEEQEDGGPVLSLQVPDVPAAYAAVTAAQCDASPLEGEAGKQSFVCVDPHGYTLHISAYTSST